MDKNGKKHPLQPKRTITYVKVEGDDETKTILDNRSKDAKWKWEHIKTEVPYNGKSLQENMNHVKKIKSFVQTIHKKTVTKYSVASGNRKVVGETSTYSQDTPVEYNKTIKYDVKSPTIEQLYFVPYDLNRNGLALESDVRASYPEHTGATKELKVQADN